MSKPLPDRRRLRFERLERRNLLAAFPTVVGAHLVYNNSAFDGGDPAANAADDTAFATDKSWLLPGATPSFANYSTYDKGINGLSIDVKDLGVALTQDSFTFKVGVSNSPQTWATAPAPTGFAVRAGQGAGSSDRATWTWADAAIKNTWLQVTLSATGAVFYFGNTPGDTGNSSANAFVSAVDEIAARNNAGPAAITSAFDFNRDGMVDSADELVARNNRRLLSSALPLIATPALNVAVISDSPTIGLANEVIHYRYTVANAGAQALTGVTLAGSGGIAGSAAAVRQADVSGDGDNLLEAGETWLYTSTATVTQAVLTQGGEVVRTASAASDQTAPQLAATGSTVALAQGDQFGNLLIRPVMHASFVMNYQGKTIYVDPVGPASLYTGLPKADYILVSHNHSDHFDLTELNALATANPSVKILAPQLVFNSMSATLRGLTTVVDYNAATAAPQSVSFLDGAMATLFSVDVVPAYNANHPFGQGNGYIVTIDNKRIYISGDTGNQPELRALEDIDIAFVCVNQPFTMTPADAASLLRDIDPLVVYPYHYRDQNGNLTNSITLKNLLSTDFAVEVRLRKWY